VDEPYELDGNVKWNVTLFNNSSREGTNNSHIFAEYTGCVNVTVGIAAVKFVHEGRTHISNLGYLVVESAG